MQIEIDNRFGFEIDCGDGVVARPWTDGKAVGYSFHTLNEPVVHIGVTLVDAAAVAGSKLGEIRVSTTQLPPTIFVAPTAGAGLTTETDRVFAYDFYLGVSKKRPEST